MWLDRGELEKIAALEDRDDSGRNDRDRRDDYHDDRHKDHGSRGDYKHGKPKRRSFLSDLMEGLGE